MHRTMHICNELVKQMMYCTLEQHEKQYLPETKFEEEVLGVGKSQGWWVSSLEFHVVD